LTFFLRRCRSCASTVENSALFGGAMRASRPTEVYRRLAVGRGDLTPPHGRTNGVFRRTGQRQRRWSRDDPFIESKKEILRERAAGTYNSVQRIARPEVKEPEVPSGTFAYFCRYWQK